MTAGGDGRAATSKVDEARFRQVLGHFATGVTVVAGLDRDRPVGLSVNAFASVSLDPPLVAVCVKHTSATWPRIRQAGRFTVNVLADDQEAVCRTFATSGADRFAGLGWSAAPSGAPILAGVLAWIDCEIEREVEGGDHLLVLGRVTALDVARSGSPLVFFRGGYGGFRP